MADNKWLRNSFVWVIIMVAMLVLFFTFVGQRPSSQQIAISDVVKEVKQGQVAKIITHEENNDIVICKDPQCSPGEQQTSVKEGTADIQKYLIDAGVSPDKLPQIEVQKAAAWGSYVGILGFLLPTLILVAVFVFMMRQAQGTNNQALSFG